MRTKTIITLFILFVFFHGLTPGANDSYTLIKNAKIFTMENKVINNGSVLIKNNRIFKISSKIIEKDNYNIIDAKGNHLYPGMIAPLTIVGLVTRPGIANDTNETGNFHPRILAADAVNTEDNSIEVTRIDGVTTVLTAPGSGSIVNGKAAVLNLKGHLAEEMIYKRYAAQIFNLGAKTKNRYPSTLPGMNQFLRDKLDQVKKYLAKKKPKRNENHEALAPVLKGKMPALFITNDAVTIRMAIAIIKDYKLKGIIYANSEIVKFADILAKNKIPVIWAGTQTMPKRWEPIQKNYETAGILKKKGVEFCLSGSGWGLPGTNTRTLPVAASISVAYGLSEKDALKALTINTAKIYGLEKNLGSIKIGKIANLIIADKSIIQASAKIKKVIINGKIIPMVSYQTRLRDKFSKIVKDRMKK